MTDISTTGALLRIQTFVEREREFLSVSEQSDLLHLLDLVNRQRAWIDGVMSQESTVSQYYDTIGRRHFTRFGETAEQIGYACQPLITRPQPFEDK